MGIDYRIWLPWQPNMYNFSMLHYIFVSLYNFVIPTKSEENCINYNIDTRENHIFCIITNVETVAMATIFGKTLSQGFVNI